MAPKRPPNFIETTPSGFEIAFYDSVGVDGEPQQRRYLVDGERFVNVTSATGIYMKEALLGWVERETRAGRDWRETRDLASKRGTSTHDLILRMLIGRASLADLADEDRAYGQAGAAWLHARAPKVLDAERTVASIEYGFAGRFDLLCELDGTVTRVDFKTVTDWSYRRSKGETTDRKLPPFFENVLQLAGYELAARESGYESSQQLLIVRLGPDGTFDETCVPYVPDRFLAALAAHGAKRDTERDLRAVAA